MINKVKSMLKGGAFLLRPGIFLLFSAALPLFADNGKVCDLSTFSHVRSAILPDMEKCLPEDTFSIVLDETFFSTPENPANGICIIDKAGKTVPFELKKIPETLETIRENQLTGRIVRNQQLPDGRNAIDFEIDENNKTVSLIELVGDKLPAGSQLTIAAGDGKNWQIAVDKLKLSDITQLADPVNRRFPLPVPLQGKIVRLILEKGRFPALEAVRVFEHQREPAQGTFTRSYNITHLGSRNGKTVLKTIYNANYIPLTRLKLQLDKELYLNKVTVLGSNDRRKWQEISSGSIRKVDLDEVDSLDFPECRYKYIMLCIEHMANAPVKVRNIRAYGSAYHYIINGGKDRKELTLYYNPATAVYSEEINIPVKAGYGISHPQPNKLHKTGVRDRASWNHLAGVLIVLLAFISAMVLTARVKRSDKLLPED